MRGACRNDDASAVAGLLTQAGAELTGLRAGTTVAVGTGDDFSNPIGVGIVSPGTVICNLGTAEVVGAVSDKLCLDSKGLVETHGFPGDRFFVYTRAGCLAGPSPGSCRPSASQRRKTCRYWRPAAPAGSDDLLFLPALSGAMAPRWVSGARGAFYGLTAFHGKAACARALSKAAPSPCATSSIGSRSSTFQPAESPFRRRRQEPGLVANPRRRLRPAGRGGEGD